MECWYNFRIPALNTKLPFLPQTATDPPGYKEVKLICFYPSKEYIDFIQFLGERGPVSSFRDLHSERVGLSECACGIRAPTENHLGGTVLASVSFEGAILSSDKGSNQELELHQSLNIC